MSDPNCFLCAPDPSLAIASLKTVYALVGLGPITQTYAMIASNVHIPSFADLAAADPGVVDDIIDLRYRLEAIRGPLLMTEHGRVPVCRDEDQHEAHCFHAHALLFGIGGGAIDHARNYYVRSVTFPELRPALTHAAAEEAYMLVSRDVSSYEILSGPLNAPRQLARTLAAMAAGDAGQADWRRDPRNAEAESIASSLRAALEKKY